MKKQSAVEWLYSHLFPKQLDGFSPEEWDKIDKAFDQAKAMEKEQIIEAYNTGELHCVADPKTSLDYYQHYYGQ